MNTLISQRDASTVSIGNWIGTIIILAIPIVNIIMALVWAFSGGTNPSKQNFCRATLIIWLIVIVIYIAVLLLTGGTVLMMGPTQTM